MLCGEMRYQQGEESWVIFWLTADMGKKVGLFRIQWTHNKNKLYAWHISVATAPTSLTFNHIFKLGESSMDDHGPVGQIHLVQQTAYVQGWLLSEASRDGGARGDTRRNADLSYLPQITLPLTCTQRRQRRTATGGDAVNRNLPWASPPLQFLLFYPHHFELISDWHDSALFLPVPWIDGYLVNVWT